MYECCRTACGSKMWHSNSPYCRMSYHCNAKKAIRKIATPPLTKDDKSGFYSRNERTGGNKKDIDEAAKRLYRKCCAMQLRKMFEKPLTRKNIITGMKVHLKAFTSSHDKLGKKKCCRKFLRNNFQKFISSIKNVSQVTKFPPEAWMALVKYITATAKNDIRFNFHNGMNL